MTVRNLFIVLAALTLAGCSWDPVPPPEPVPAERVLLMYDNIGDWFYDDVKEAGRAVSDGAIEANERVVVFHRNYRVPELASNRSVIYELVKDSSQPEGFRREMLKVYDSGVNAALSKEVIESVVGDIRGAIPAQHYGLAFGSHGMGWVPASYTGRIMRGGGVHDGVGENPFGDPWADGNSVLTRYLLGYGQKLDVSEFVDALDEWPWDFIILDDCFMASVEALYEMRDLADYIIASPTEIMGAGFPYDRVVNTIFADWSETGFKQAGWEFVDYYTNVGDTGVFSGTIAVVKMAELENLATTVSRMNLIFDELNPDTEKIQYYEGIGNGHIFWDMDDYLIHIRKERTPTEYNAFKAQLDRTVVYKGHTDSFYTDAFLNKGLIKINDNFSGINVFIPWSRTESLKSYYEQTEWFKAVYAQ
jgi:hypothetical protein